MADQKKRKADQEEKEDLRLHENAPVVQVKKISLFKDGGYAVTISCCYCFKDHVHGPGCDITEEVPDDLGHRVPHCANYCRGKFVGYHISTKAWKAAERKIERAK